MKSSDPMLGDLLRDAVERAAYGAVQRGRAQWVALRVPVSWHGIRDRCERTAAERFFLERPAEERCIVGFGVAHAIECSGPSRFVESAARASELFRALYVTGEAAPESAGPLLVGGFGFAAEQGEDERWRDFPAARLVLPEILFSRLGDRAWCTVVRKITPGESAGEAGVALRALLTKALAASDEKTLESTKEAFDEGATANHHIVSDHPHAHYRSQVGAALRTIASGDLEKVVVARSVRVLHEAGYDVAAILRTLRSTYPSCASFAVTRPSGTFLGATPERLICVENGRALTAALAGSAPRGRSPEEDARIGRALFESKKNQSEHAVVVRALRDALAPCCSELEVAQAPRLLRVDGIQHLETPVTGVLKGDFSAIELAGRLHPAPSVAGAPRDAALDWLAREENLDRGWYAAPIGWTDASGSGEFCVALRSALLRDGEASLFAGAGIVSGSDPEDELEETRLKLRALLAPLLEL